MKVLMQPQHKMSTTMHQGREDANVSSRILAQGPMMRKCHMPLNVQWKKRNKYYTGHKTLQILKSHRAIVCIICDRFIIGTEKIHKLSSYQISQHTNRLSDKTYETYHGVELINELKKKYQVKDNKLRNLLLSTWSRKYHNGYATCACCYKGMCQSSTNKKTLPKYAIANGFVIGSLPMEIKFTTKDGNRKKGQLNSVSWQIYWKLCWHQ